MAVRSIGNFSNLPSHHALPSYLFQITRQHTSTYVEIKFLLFCCTSQFSPNNKQCYFGVLSRTRLLNQFRLQSIGKWAVSRFYHISASIQSLPWIYWSCYNWIFTASSLASLLTYSFFHEPPASVTGSTHHLIALISMSSAALLFNISHF